MASETLGRLVMPRHDVRNECAAAESRHDRARLEDVKAGAVASREPRRTAHRKACAQTLEEIVGGVEHSAIGPADEHERAMRQG